MYPNNLLFTVIHWLVSGLALFVTSKIVPGFKIRNFSSALIAVVVIGLANIFIRPALLFLTFPLNVLTLGFFTFVVDALILKMCAAILRDFDITSWWSAILGALILALSQAFLHSLLV